MKDYDAWYRTLKALNPAAYEKAIRYADGIAIQHGLPLKVASDIEKATVMLACELLEIQP